MKKKLLVILLGSIMILSIAGCGAGSSNDTAVSNRNSNSNSGNMSSDTTTVKTDDENNVNVSELEVKFGREAFTIHLYDNATAKEVAKYVGESSWNLPIYHFDDYENYEVMQYYDVPSRYKFTSEPETITSEKAGEVYYSDPNRIVLFYEDAEVTGDYTKIGYIDYSEEFHDAVVNNPVVQGWSNKIVSIGPMD